jgi:hypothetical protein
MGQISSIDDLLMGIGNTQQAATPEHKDKLQKEEEEKAPIEEMEEDEVGYEDEDEKADAKQASDEDEAEDDSDTSDEDTSEDDDSSDNKGNISDNQDDVDEYGNPKERMSKGMKERLDRKEKQFQREIEQRDAELQALRQQLAQQGASREVQQAAKDFKYDPNDEGSWQQQLTDFVKQTINSVKSEEKQRANEQQEHQAQREFQKKFTTGMQRFDDFREVVGKMPMDDAMTLALRGMDDPTAFIYAASKRNPQEIERISKLPDPYARMVEMGRLEERMRRPKPVTKAPRPLGRAKEDTVAKVKPKDKKDTTGDDLLAKADAKRLSQTRARHARNR